VTENESAGPMRLWGGRFEGGPAAALAQLSLSVHFDWRLARYDLRASRAHARMLHRAGLLSDDEADAMLRALDDLDRSVEEGTFRPTVADEDVHTALERGLLERLGSLGGKLRAGRSRNDQIATDLRLYLRDHARMIVSRIAELQTALITQAEAATTLTAAGTDWHQADEDIMGDAAIVPLMSQTFPTIASTRVRSVLPNGTTYQSAMFSPNIGDPDIANIWLAGSGSSSS